MTDQPSTSSSVLQDLTAPYLPFDPSSNVWSDLIPTPQSDITSSSPMCPILYNQPYSSAMDLYRTLTSSNSSPLSQVKLSPRALALTSHLIQLNPSHFSVWQYRANILLYSSELDKIEGGREAVLVAELEWLEALAHSNMKSYQVWQHRRVVVSALGRPGRELEFVEQNLDRDSKNYHTWGYRQWILAHFGGLSLPTRTTIATDTDTSREKAALSRGAAQFPQLWEGEAEYVDKLLREDVRNNSAWNHRWFINFSRFGLTGNPSSPSTPLYDNKVMQELKNKVKYEIAYTKSSLSNVPNNASAWNYLRALHTSLPSALSTEMKHALGWVKTLVSSSVEAEKDASVDVMGRGSVGALEWWLDCLAQQTEAQQKGKDAGVEEIETLIKRLIVADPVRKRFYAYRRKTIRRSLTTLPPIA